MASFPEVVLRVRFRWQQFNKYMVPTVTFPLSLRVSEIAAFVVQHATFPTPPLVSSKFSHVPLGVG